LRSSLKKKKKSSHKILMHLTDDLLAQPQSLNISQWFAT